MLTTPEIVKTDLQQTAVIHLTIPRDQIQAAMGPAIGEVMAAVAAQGIAPAGPLFSYHLRLEPDSWDFEVGLPVTTPVQASGRVRPGQLPATTVVRAIYQGDYAGLGEAWGELNAWIATAGQQPAPTLWERYVTGPETSADPAAWRTELNRPLIAQAE